MAPSDFDISRDYNRSLAWPVRVTHMSHGLVRLVFGPWIRWLSDPMRRWWTTPLLAGLLILPALLSLDGPIARFATEHPPRGDVRRELEAIQQFGQGVSLLVIMSAIWLLDPRNRRRLFDLAAAAASTGLLVLVLKVMVGRPRPRPEFKDPLYFLGPLGEYPVKEGVGVRHAWEFWNGISSDLWSMPSSHTAYAVVMAIFLSRSYPRIKPLSVGLASIVGVARVWLSAHYPTDVLVGALAALSLAPRAIDRSWGQLLVDRLTGVRAAVMYPALNIAQTDSPRTHPYESSDLPVNQTLEALPAGSPPTTSPPKPENERPSV